MIYRILVVCLVLGVSSAHLAHASSRQDPEELGASQGTSGGERAKAPPSQQGGSLDIRLEDYLAYKGPGHPVVFDETGTKPFVYNLSRPLSPEELQSLTGKPSKSLRYYVALFEIVNGRPPKMHHVSKSLVCIDEDFLGLGSGLILFNGCVKVPVEALLNHSGGAVLLEQGQSLPEDIKHMSPPLVEAEAIKLALIRQFNRPSLADNLSPLQYYMLLKANSMNAVIESKGGARRDFPEFGVYYH
ncbi:MAG: hypothetical protein ACK5O7_06595 [Holosporales bacterium]